ncbi:MAG: hypothetical protein AAB346_04775, partial [Pseudomonadota bacterium]
ESTSMLSPSKKSPQILNEELQILKHVARNEGLMMEEQLPRIGKSRIRKEFHIGELARKGFLKRKKNRDGDYYLELTHEGKAVLIEHGLV